MTPEEKEIVMREAWEAWELDQRTNPEHVNPAAFVYGYFVGLHTEREHMSDDLNTEKHLVNVYNKQLSAAHGIIKELLRALYHGEMELRTIYSRHTPYTGSTYLWLMQEMLEKYKYYLDENEQQENK